MALAAAARLYEAPMSDERARQEDVTQSISAAARMQGCTAGTRFGRYRLLRKLGEGGMGVVWLAEQTEPIRRQVALKLVQQSRQDRHARVRFELERQMLAQVAHPGIAQIFDAGTQVDGVAWFAMEHVEGQRLDTWWQEKKPTLIERIELMVALCRTVGHAHRRGIVHCDLKPANVLVVDDHGAARPKVIDFGIARVIGNDDAELQGGTPGFMAPEQSQAGALDARTDVYALGRCLWLALAGKEDGDPAAAGVLALLPLRLSHARRDELAALLACALDHDPAKRYEDAHVLADELERWLRDRPLAVLSSRRGYRWRCWLRRHRWPVLAAGTFSALALVFSLQLWQQYRQTQMQRDTAEQVVQLLVDTFAAADPVQFPGGSATARELLTAATARVQREALPAPVRQRLLEALGTAQHSLELYADARQSLALARSTLAQDDLAGRDRLGLQLARIDSDAEDYESSDAAAAQIVERQRLRNPALAADSLMLRADNALLQDETASAADHVAAAAALIAASDADRQRQLAVLHARLAEAQGDPQAALKHQRTALALAATQWSAHDLRTLDLLNDLALYAGQAGQHAEAIAQLERVAELTAAAWGSDSAGLATVYGNLGVNRLRAGDAAGAEAEHRRAVEIFEQRLGRDSVHTGTEYNNLAVAILDQDRASEALPWFERAEAALIAAVGEQHFRVGVTMHNHARARIAIGELDVARALLDRAAAILEPALGREHPRWQVWRVSDAEWKLAQGDAVSAMATLEEVAPALTRSFGAHSREAKRANELWVRAQIVAGRCIDAQARHKPVDETLAPLPECDH